MTIVPKRVTTGNREPERDASRSWPRGSRRRAHEAQGHDSIGRVAGERGRRQSPLSSHMAYGFLIVGKLPGGIIVWMPQGLALTLARNQTIGARIVCAQ